MKRKYAPVIIILVAGFVIATSIGIYLYNKPHKNIEFVDAAFKLSSGELLTQFESVPTTANSLYLNKVIEVTGTIQSFSITESKSTILLSVPGNFYGINCSLASNQTENSENIKEGENITIKGECKGYIDDVILTNCLIIK